MTIKSKYSLEIQNIKNDLDLLKKRQIYEFDRVPGVASCVTIGQRLEENINLLLNKIDNDVIGNIEGASEILNNN